MKFCTKNKKGRGGEHKSATTLIMLTVSSSFFSSSSLTPQDLVTKVSVDVFLLTSVTLLPDYCWMMAEDYFAFEHKYWHFVFLQSQAFTFILTLASPCQGIQLFLHSMKFLCEVFYFIFQDIISFLILQMVFFLLFNLIHL